MTADVSWMATLNAALNATSGVLLLVGRRQIARGDVPRHRRTMLAAVWTSGAFLTSYVVYHALAGSRPYPGTGVLRGVYFTVLVPHVLLAFSLVWLVPRTVFLGLRDRRAEHRRLARWTYPVWLVVSVTGVIVYLMLYPLAPSAEGP
jgi:putative membrane protein